MLTLTESPLTAPALHEAAIDLSAIRENAAVLVARAGSRPLLADVAADGYGHGALDAALAAIAGGAAGLRVSDPSELVVLGDLGVEVFVTRGPHAAPGGAVFATEELYGLTADAELRPAMRVSARVIGTKTIDTGDGVSYGYTYRAASRTNLALVGLGYADGVRRAASNVGRLSLGGRARLIAGRVAMNALVLELGDDTARVGDEAVVFGDPRAGEPHILDWAASLGMTAAEVACGFGAHLPRSHR